MAHLLPRRLEANKIERPLSDAETRAGYEPHPRDHRPLVLRGVEAASGKP